MQSDKNNIPKRFSLRNRLSLAGRLSDRRSYTHLTKREMKSAKLLLGMLLLTSLCFDMSCSEGGDTGPAGEKGDKGDIGQPEAAGQDGAGVIYSPWFNVEFV